jgi:hypothetical protein
VKERARRAGVLLALDIPSGAWIISHLLFRILRPGDKGLQRERAFSLLSFVNVYGLHGNFPLSGGQILRAPHECGTRDLARCQKSFNGGGPRKIKFADAAF